MIPSVLSTQVRQGVEDFLRTTYPPAEPFFADVLESLIAEQHSLFKGPYVSLKLPFRPGVQAEGHFQDIPMAFPPYRHQERAYERLKGDSPRSTLVATGTGSGKTECFLYPLLDYCFRHRGEPGVKAIIVYPMNALATDQARRFAKEIFNNPGLNGNLTAGLFIGGLEKGEGKPAMSDEMVITDQARMREAPPDILMTNYKMLDYLLLRPQDYSLWQGNRPDTLKFVVVDELHTFDGAQGTDLACLLRRLLDRLKTPRGQVCFVGTSATLGDDGGSADALLEFASSLFGCPFDLDSVIREDLLRPVEFLGENTLIRYHQAPSERDLAKMNPADFSCVADYIRSQCALWFDGWEPEGELDAAFAYDLGTRLREHLFFQNFIRLLKGQTLSQAGIMAHLDRLHAGYAQGSEAFRTALLDSMLALVATARSKAIVRDGKTMVPPFLQLRLQLWLKELRRMVVSVGPSPRLRFSDDVLPEEGVRYLPILHCRACGRMGWLSTMPEGEHRLSDSLQKIYGAFFSNSPTVQYIFHEDRASLPVGTQLETAQTLCGDCLGFTYGEKVTRCEHCGGEDRLIPVRRENPRKQNKNGKWYVYKNCPHCGEHESLTILGSRSASLISVAISQLFASVYNDDRKLLTFSDSVQDASHRAGFFGARTYRFNLRAALQQVVERSGDTLTLSRLAPAFMSYWLQRLGTPEAFAAQFIAPDMQWHEEFVHLETNGTLPAGGELMELIRKRMDWEVLYEYGHGARIGRTLEKTGCSTVRLSPVLLDVWAREIHVPLREAIGVLREVSLDDIKRFLVGLVRICRVRGGIYGPFLQGYIEEAGNAWRLRNLPFMPNSNRTPSFIYDGPGAISRFDSLIASGSGVTTYQRWLARCFPGIAPYSRDVYDKVLPAALKHAVLVMVPVRSGRVYGLNPEALEIEKSVDQWVCSKTRYSVSAPSSERALWEQMPSERYDVPNGVLEREESARNYYGDLYRSGQVQRAVPKEHTGLLERGEREALENRFMKGTGPTDPNILSCTPTLEMGINIGDLSTVVLCSVPPTQANYLQRIGRAGRRDGNAFNLVVAAGRPHDLHFFAEPENMVSGQVTPPGIFLNAPAVLERQLTAFCFDRWMQAIAGKAGAVPVKLKGVLDQIGSGPDPQKFPYNLTGFIDLHRTALLDAFVGLFKDVLQAAAIKHLQAFMQGSSEREGTLCHCIINRLCQALRERDGLRARLRALQVRIRKNEDNPARDPQLDGELTEMKFEKSALNRLVRDMHEKLTFNFFTDEGLLPNYAFPESGVSLRSVIYRKKSKADGKGRYDTWVHEYERPAAAAIQELAPGNAFYVDGRKLKIDQVDMSVSEKERWRFCGSCQHAEIEARVEQKAACPKCGCRSWADAAMVRTLLKMKQVVATQDDRDSRSHDDSDDREPVFYNKHMLTEVRPEYIEKAYRIKDESLPFGFEFVRKAVFREVNFGQQDFFDGDAIQIAGNKVSRQGFLLCDKCGKVVPERKPESFRHAIDCAYYGGASSEKGMTDCLYMYRQFESEAIRILLPVAEAELGSQMPSFIAALYMGLSETFRGSVGHLQLMITDEPVPDTSLRKKYLVLYDQVPGGTGYLKELMKTPDAIMGLLQKAFDKLRACACQADAAKDGCYQCLFAYRVSRDLPDISRRKAMGLLERILQHRQDLESISSVDAIQVNALFESELEARFIEALRRSSTPDIPVELRSEVVNGKPGYFLRVNRVGYQIEPQVEIGTQQGVSVKSRADFVIYPLREGLPVAVFTDGYAYHADPGGGHYRLPQDLEQRQALVASGRFLCWSLSYEDVMSRFDERIKDHWTHFHQGSIDPLLRNYEKHPLIRQTKAALEKTALDGLVLYLALPDKEEWSLQAFLYALSLGQRGLCEPEIAETAAGALLQAPVLDTDPFRGLLAGGSGSVFWNGRVLPADGSRAIAALMAYGDAAQIRKNEITALRCVVRLDDGESGAQASGFKRLWNGLLQMMNLLQFLPTIQILSTRFIADGYSIPVHEADVQEKAQSSVNPVSAAYKALSELVYDDAALKVLDLACQMQLSAPDVGFELCDDDGRVLVEAELAWPAYKIALLLAGVPPTEFERSGWRCVLLDVIESINDLENLFGQKETE
jgi:DEAD/DEAH box helicase domain-containing protein